MGIEEILTLIESIQRTDIQELEVSNGEWRVRITRLKPSAGFPHTNDGSPMAEITVPPDSSSTPAVPPETPENPAARGYVEINSPMVGTFYRSPEPGAESFVGENDIVMPGQTMCIIEAMKLMNPIQSEIKGRIVSILVDNAQPVEYGQPLFLLEPV